MGDNVWFGVMNDGKDADGFVEFWWDLPREVRNVCVKEVKDEETTDKNERIALGCEKQVVAKALKESKKDVYVRLVGEMKARWGIRINKWRKGATGCAWEVVYEGDDRVRRLIEAPNPKGPVSAAIFLHEVGHHAIGFHRYKPRCLEEFKAWEWALDTMREYGLEVTERVEKHVEDAMKYSVSKATRRGIKNLPPEVKRWAPAPRKLPKAPGNDPRRNLPK